MTYELSNYSKNQGATSHNPDGSGNPPDFFSGDYFTSLLFSSEFSELCLQRTAGIAFPEKALPIAIGTFVAKKNFQNPDSFE
ncbi:hypothetical protein [Flavobacterium saliperosum]|uniref:Uncharacterized protein n=1 Tax=Flavobacterium saliperosum TaxID=329186 RepID=A0A1G4V2J1_9FLAO|nr:hypothetical protein [Flavobacterium saliperosum]SCX00193.1 hypothetical protein SAMN02927925_00115 [Flavobacterium saliperosum]